MAQAYDFALDKMGMDVQAHQIWVDYIEFLKGVEAVGTYAENQRITGKGGPVKSTRVDPVRFPERDTDVILV